MSLAVDLLCKELESLLRSKKKVIDHYNKGTLTKSGHEKYIQNLMPKITDLQEKIRIIMEYEKTKNV